MGNPFFENQNRRNIQNPNPTQQPPQQLDLNKLFNEFKQNPFKYLSGLNLPPDIQTPEQASAYSEAGIRIGR